LSSLGAVSSPSQVLQLSGARMTGIRLCSLLATEFGGHVMIVQLLTRSP
jgi:hypothetical protein